VIPGLVDAHLHVESSHLRPRELARLVVPRGTTAIVADPHEIANVHGLAGVRYVVEASRGLPLDVFLMAPSCVPATDMETAGAVLGPAEVAEALGYERVVGLAEVMSFPAVVAGEEAVLAKILEARGRPVDGHAPRLSGGALRAYAAAGVESDHECTTLEEAREKLALGFHLFIREGSAARNLEALLPAVNDVTFRRVSFCCDDRSASDVDEIGHVDAILRLAVGKGLDPVRAVTLATLNPARRFGLAARGAVAPGYRADLAVVSDLRDFAVDLVVKDGRVVARGGRLVADPPEPRVPALPPSVRIAPLSLGSFRIEARGRRALAIEIVPDQIVTQAAVVEVRTGADGGVIADPASDVAKIAVVERHFASGRIGLGLVKGFSLRGGALASTFAHDSHDLIVIGDGDRDMLVAARRAAELGGGFVVAASGEVVAEMPLPIAGLLSDRPYEEVVRADRALLAACRRLGVAPRVPFLTLSFLALPVIPALKITDRGLVDVDRFRFVDHFDVASRGGASGGL
jgi:adenine deaminase